LKSSATHCSHCEQAEQSRPGRTSVDATSRLTRPHEGALWHAVEVFPAHFSGSACGVGLSGKPSSTIAFEKQWNPMLTVDRDAFVRVLSSQVLNQPEGMEATLRFNQGRS